MDSNQSHTSNRGRGRTNHQNYRPGPRNNFNSSENYQQQNFQQNGNEDEDGINRRLKKPEQQFYVPRPQNLTSTKENYSRESYSKSPIPPPSSHNTYNDGNRLNYKNNRGNNNQNQNRNQRFNNSRNNQYSDSRDIRQTSEPRGPSNHQQNNYTGMNDRQRDCRSVEPNFIPREKKPPTGRRNSTASDLGIRLPQNIESLPPRLQRKCLLDSGLPEDYLTQLQNNKMEESSLSMKALVQSIEQHQYGSSSSFGPQNWSQTLPNARGKGRANFKNEHDSQPDYSRPRSRSSDVGFDENEQRPPSRNFDRSNDYRMKNNFRSSNRSLNYENERYENNNYGNNFNRRGGPPPNEYQNRTQNFNHQDRLNYHRNQNQNDFERNNNRNYGDGYNNRVLSPKPQENVRKEPKTPELTDYRNKNEMDSPVSPAVLASPKIDMNFVSFYFACFFLLFYLILLCFRIGLRKLRKLLVAKQVSMN